MTATAGPVVTSGYYRPVNGFCDVCVHVCMLVLGGLMIGKRRNDVCV